MAHSSTLSRTDLTNISARIDKMNADLTNLTRVLEKLLINLEPILEKLPPIEEEITVDKAKPSKQELYFERYNVLNIDSEAGATATSEKTSTRRIQSNEKFPTQYLPGYIPTLTCASFPMKVVGDVFYVGDGVTSVVGDAEIPSGTIVDATLVVKGNFTLGENCRLLRDVKALKDISIGPNTVVEGKLVAGGKVIVGPSCVAQGSIESEGDIIIGENAVIEGILCSKSSIVVGQSARVLRCIYAAKGLSAQ